MARKLKVFRIPIGFHDAYVAAPSQKAALEAWGADADLFARGVAELVEDAALSREPLAHPGQVIRLARGSTNEHLAALGSSTKETTTSRRKHTPARSQTTASSPKRSAVKSRPRPSRASIETAEAAIRDAETRHGRAEEDLRERQREIDRERRAMQRQQEAELAKLTRARDRAKAHYDAAMKRWREN